MNEYSNKLAAGTQIQICDVRQTRTIGQNLDDRIAHLESEVKRLKELREHLARGGSLLDVSIDAMRMATNY
jgi:hypothetical protein